MSRRRVRAPAIIVALLDLPRQPFDLESLCDAVTCEMERELAFQEEAPAQGWIVDVWVAVEQCMRPGNVLVDELVREPQLGLFGCSRMELGRIRVVAGFLEMFGRGAEEVIGSQPGVRGERACRAGRGGPV